MTEPSQPHEFSSDDNAAFTKLATRMRGVGFWCEVYGFVLIGVFVYHLIPKNEVMRIEPITLITGLFFLMLGHWTRRGGKAFRKIVDTEGRDHMHLMNAVGELSKLYGLIDRLILIAIVLVIVSAALVAMFVAKGGL